MSASEGVLGLPPIRATRQKEVGMTWFLSRRGLVCATAAALLLPKAAAAQAEQQALVDRATLTVNELMGGEFGSDVRQVLRRARAVMIFPRLFRGGFILGGEGGSGVLVARDGAAAGKVAAEIGNGAKGFSADVADWDSAQAMAKAAADAFGGIDILCANAGIYPQTRLEEMDPIARGLLVERRLMSPDFLQGSRERGLILDTKGIVSVMVNEEDHLRIQVLLGRMSLCEALRIASAIDRALYRLEFAFDQEFGFLTSCPTNVGTGLRASAMLHLPALKMSRAMPEIIAQSGRLGLVVRGAYGEGTTSAGALYQVSNQVTLGLTPEELTEKVEAVGSRLVEQESRARETLFNGSRELEDRIWRAWGTLMYARRLGLAEAMECLSLLRMAQEAGMKGPFGKVAWGPLFLSVQPAHVQAMKGRLLQEEETETARAELVRETLGRL